MGSMLPLAARMIHKMITKMYKMAIIQLMMENKIPKNGIMLSSDKITHTTVIAADKIVAW